MRKKELRCFLTEIRQQEVLRINAAIAHERQMETLHKQRHDIGEILGRRVEESTIDAARRVVQSIESSTARNGRRDSSPRFRCPAWSRSQSTGPRMAGRFRREPSPS